MPTTPTKTRGSRQHPELMTLTEVADRFGVHYRTVRRWVSEGRINAVRIGPKLLKVDANNVAALMKPVGGGAK